MSAWRITCTFYNMTSWHDTWRPIWLTWRMTRNAWHEHMTHTWHMTYDYISTWHMTHDIVWNMLHLWHDTDTWHMKHEVGYMTRENVHDTWCRLALQLTWIWHGAHLAWRDPWLMVQWRMDSWHMTAWCITRDPRLWPMMLLHDYLWHMTHLTHDT
jgi:hypothetical protein